MTFRGIGQTVNIPLFKYYGNINYAVDAVENSRIHLEPPSAYNDIYDSTRKVGEEGLYHIFSGKFLYSEIALKYCDLLSNSEVDDLYKKNMSAGQIIDYLCSINKDIDRDKFIQESCCYFTQGKNIFQSSNNKISCFSEVNDSLLMWAYYANNYAGICIRFNAPKDAILSQYCRKVQYTNHYISDNSFGTYFRKSIQWSHEQEWRIVCDMKEEYIPINSIDALYIGIRMEEEVEQQVLELGKKHNLEVYKMKVSDTKYEILFDRVL